MKWLWFVGPLMVLVVAWLVGMQPSLEERRLRRVVQRWLDEYLGPLRTAAGRGTASRTKSRRVHHLPAIFNRLLEAVGGRVRMTDAVLVPKLAYLAVRLADHTTSANHVSVVCKLSRSVPDFLCRPLAIVDGRPAENDGVHFSKHPEFTETFVVEGEDDRAIRRWLRPALRDALLELPEVWVRVQGNVVAVTIYGTGDEELLDELVGVADAIFAEHGAGGGASLFPETAPELVDDEESEYEDEPAQPMLRLQTSAIDVGLYVLAALTLAAMSGSFESFHPSVLFTSPDLQATEPWQGGWTTKGFAAFLAAEALLVGLFVGQSFLAATRGRSIGKVLLGARVTRRDGKPITFLRGVFLRTWVFAVVPLGVAVWLALRTGGPSARVFLAQIPRLPTLAAAALVVVIAAASIFANKDRRALQDLLSGTQVVETDSFRLSPLQLGVGGTDPVMTRRALRVGVLIALFVLANVAVFVMELDYWIY